MPSHLNSRFLQYDHENSWIVGEFLVWKPHPKDKNVVIINNIIPQAQMGSESIAHKAEGRMVCWLRGHEGKRDIIVLAKFN